MSLNIHVPIICLGLLLAVLAGGCGRSAEKGPADGSGGKPPPAGGALSSGGAGGWADGGSGGVFGSGGGVPPLEPTEDCIHPEVVERCEGEFCRIPAGCFIMGAPPDEFGRAVANADQVQVRLTHAFWIGRTEVTRSQWKRSSLPIPQLSQLNGERECLEDDCPQSNAHFYEALRYANRLSEMEGLSPCYVLAGAGCTGSVVDNNYKCPSIQIPAGSPYACEGYRLLTEAEWEYAARAGTKTAFPTGPITVQKDAGGCYPDAALDQIGWYCINSPDQVQRAAQKAPNGWGVHDMHGNVAEFVSDLYGPYGYLEGSFGFKEGPLVDPTGVMSAPNDITARIDADRVFRVMRGGTHVFPAYVANSSLRSIAFDSNSASNYGFRVARTIHDGTGGEGGGE